MECYFKNGLLVFFLSLPLFLSSPVTTDHKNYLLLSALFMAIYYLPLIKKQAVMLFILETGSLKIDFTTRYSVLNMKLSSEVNIVLYRMIQGGLMNAIFTGGVLIGIVINFIERRAHL